MMHVRTIKLSDQLSANTSFWLILCLYCISLVSPAQAATLDAATSEDLLLGPIANALAAYDIDVTTNLNVRDVVRQRIEQPRLGRFPDLPMDRLPVTGEILEWEAAFQNSQIGGLAILAEQESTNVDRNTAITLEQWLNAESLARIFITFHIDDLPAMEKIQQVVAAYAFQNLLSTDPARVAAAGELYSTAAQRLALDSRSARRDQLAVTELAYLGERVRRDSNSLFKTASAATANRSEREEPALFLKESLGDEFNQSTIREIIVPGGVALGEVARLDLSVASLLFANDRIVLIDGEGRRWELPTLAPATLKALFDFVANSQTIQSDAIVDIDAEGRVRIASSLRDTDAGFAIMAADTQPFEYVRNLDVTKSVIIDTSVNWFRATGANSLEFATDFEVRFLSADNMRIAQTRVALEYEYESVADTVAYTGNWGRDAGRLQDNLDYAGLGTSVEVVANYAGWIGLLRALDAARVPFLQGRYAFMKIDKTGRSTPARY